MRDRSLVDVLARSWVVVSDEMARIGLKDNWSFEISRHNDGLLVAATAVLVQSACGRVAILAYRGTEPRDLVNFGTDFDAYPIDVPSANDAEDPDGAKRSASSPNVRA